MHINHINELTGLIERLELRQAIEALDFLVLKGSFVPRNVLYTVLQRCTSEKNLSLGRKVHSLAVKTGDESHPFLANHILRMYTSYGQLSEAMDVFTGVGVKDTFMWYSVISSHVKHRLPEQAMRLYLKMRSTTETEPNNYVLVSALNACIAAGDVQCGIQVHSDSVQMELDSDIYVGNCLVDMYSKFGRLEDSRRAFEILPVRDVVTWNSIIAAYAEQGFCEEALSLYSRMQNEGNSSADGFTFSCLLKACANAESFVDGNLIYAHIQEASLKAETVLFNCLIDMFVKCGSLDDACSTFQNLEARDTLTWNSMISGYVQHNAGEEAVSLYSCMLCEGMFAPDAFSFACLLKACTKLGALFLGKQLHLQIRENIAGVMDSVIGTCLVDMYSKCDSLSDAVKVFSGLCERDVATWNAMIDAYGQRNHAEKAILCFQQMQVHGIKPDITTFTSLLVAFNRQGLIREGREYFNLMVNKYCIGPTEELSVFMVDLFGRLGHLDEAENLLIGSPFESSIGWTSLLHASKNHGDFPRAKRCFQNIVRLEPENASAYVLMENIQR